MIKNDPSKRKVRLRSGVYPLYTLNIILVDIMDRMDPSSITHGPFVCILTLMNSKGLSMTDRVSVAAQAPASTDNRNPPV
jgi:hypothetical protein